VGELEISHAVIVTPPAAMALTRSACAVVSMTSSICYRC
jgi:hypothetical protein